MHPNPTAYGRYIGLDDNRLNTGTYECPDLKLLPDIFEDTKSADKQLKDGDASVSEALVSIQEAHSVSERISSSVLFCPSRRRRERKREKALLYRASRLLN